MPSNRSSCPCTTKPLLSILTFCKDSVSSQWRPWSDCMEVQADLGICSPCMLKDTFLNGAAHLKLGQSLEQTLHKPYWSTSWMGLHSSSMEFCSFTQPQSLNSSYHLTLVLLNPDILCLCKQCRSRSAGFWRSQLIWIYNVYHEVCEFVSTTWFK